MKKHIAALIFCILFVAGFIGISTNATGRQNTPPLEETIPTEPIEEIIVLDIIEFERIEPTTLDEANTMLETAKIRKENANMIYNGLIELGYPENHPAVILALSEIQNTELDYIYYEEKQIILQKEYNWGIRMEEYPIATQVWLYMRDVIGWNEYVCAGVMGNMMTECGG